MTKHNPSIPQDAGEQVINPNPLSKREVVEHALEGGITDPKEIVKFAVNYKVKITVDEVIAIIAELKKKKD